MRINTDKIQKNKVKSLTDNVHQKARVSEYNSEFVDNRTQAFVQRKLQAVMDDSPKATQLKKIQEIANQQHHIAQQLQNTKNISADGQTIQLFPEKLSELQAVPAKTDHRGKQLYKDEQGLFYTKSEGEQRQNDAQLDLLYTTLGTPVPESKDYPEEQGGVRLTRYEETKPLEEYLKAASGDEQAKILAQVKSGFVGDALIGGAELRVGKSGVFRFYKQHEGLREYPTEMWSMRPKEAAGKPGHTSIRDVAEQVDKLSTIDEKTLPPILFQRLMHARDIAIRAKAMLGDQFKPEYTDEVMRHTIGLRKQGLDKFLPKKLTRAEGAAGSLLDSATKIPFGGLRKQQGESSFKITSAGELVKNYMEDIKADSYESIEEFAGDWSGSATNPKAMRAKEYFNSQRDKPRDSYYWQEGYPAPGRDIDFSDKERTAWPVWHAFTQELLAKTDMPNNDQAGRKLKLFRTEDAEVMKSLGGYGANKTMKRAVLAAGSLMEPTSVGGSHFTEQSIPHHRVLSTYLTNRMPGYAEKGFFKDDTENEVVFMPEGISFDYMQSINRSDSTKDKDKAENLFDGW